MSVKDLKILEEIISNSESFPEAYQRASVASISFTMEDITGLWDEIWNEYDYR